MIAASAADIDGISMLFGRDAYWKYHHTFGHNIFGAIAISALLAAFTPNRKLASFVLFVALFHLHFLMDYYGSGPGWHIHYIWPLPGLIWKNPNAWEFYSWQNMLVFFLCLLWTLWIARYKQRTPLETIMPHLNAELVELIRQRKPAALDPHNE
jgi:hypothetical protein